jgi:hypothetical protein
MYKPLNIKPYRPLFEARSHPDKNPFIGAWDYIEQYKNDPDVYISFTTIDKIGINPQSEYNTPLGIYCYPLRELFGKYEEYQTQAPPGYYVPFAGHHPYINFIRVKDKAHFVNDMYKDYGSNDYDRDIGILRNKYKESIIQFSQPISLPLAERFFDALRDRDTGINTLHWYSDNRIFYNDIYNYEADKTLKDRTKWSIVGLALLNAYKNKVITSPQDIIKISNDGTLNKIIFQQVIINIGLETAKEKNPVMSMWNITKLLAEKLSANDKQASTKWNLILSKDLGYSGFADKSGRGYIHESEKTQAVFFNTRAFELLHRVENKPKKKESFIIEYMQIYVGEQPFLSFKEALANAKKLGSNWTLPTIDDLFTIDKWYQKTKKYFYPDLYWSSSFVNIKEDNMDFVKCYDFGKSMFFPNHFKNRNARFTAVKYL